MMKWPSAPASHLKDLEWKRAALRQHLGQRATKDVKEVAYNPFPVYSLQTNLVELRPAMKRILENLRSIPWLQIIMSVVIFILGLFAQPMLETRTAPLFNPANLPLTIFILVSVLFAVVIAIWNNTRHQITLVANNTGVLAKHAGQRLRILSHMEGYEEVRKRTQIAGFEILKLIYYEMDPRNGKPIYESALLESPIRKATYLQEREKLRKESGKDNFRYVEVVQTPIGYSLEKILACDPLYRENCEFLAGFSKGEPEFASLRTSEVIFPNTLIIIDRAFLYVAFRTKNPDTGSYEYPFIGLLIEDPDSEVVRSMVKLYHRIEAHSNLITAIDHAQFQSVNDT